MTQSRRVIRRALRAYARDDYGSGLSLCEQALRRDPRALSALFLACRILYKRSQYGRLRRMLGRCTYRRARAAGPRFEGLYCYYRGKCCQFSLQYAVALGWLARALECFGRAGRPTDRIETLLSMAEVCRMLQGEYRPWGEILFKEAKREIARLGSGRYADRLRAMYHGFVGRWRLSAGDPSEARRHFAADRTLALATGDTEYVPFMDIMIARCLNDLGRPAEAAETLAAVPLSYVKRHPKERLYYLLELAFVAASRGRRAGREAARRARLSVSRSDHRDPYAYLRLVEVFERMGDGDGVLEVCRDGVRMVEQARGRLRGTECMQEFREWWSPFYRRAIVELVRRGDPDALVFHVMNHTRTLVDLLAWGRGGRMPERIARDRTLSPEEWERALAGARGGVRLDRRAVGRMLARAVAGRGRPVVVFTTWVKELGGLFAVLWAQRMESGRGAVILPPWTCRTDDPMTPAGRCQIQAAFGRWLAEQPEPSRVVLIPDDLTRGVALHTADVDGCPAFCVAPIVYQFSLALAAGRADWRTDETAQETVAFLYDDSERTLGARPECAELAAVVQCAENPRRCASERLTVGSFTRALRHCDVVHVAGHHCEGTGGGIRTSDGRMVRQPDILGLRRCRARLVTAALCDSAASSSSSYNEPRGLITALLAVGCRAVVATRAPVTGQESVDWMSEFYHRLFGRAGAASIDSAYFETMDTMYWLWGSAERAGKFVLFGG